MLSFKLEAWRKKANERGKMGSCLKIFNIPETLKS